MSRNKNRIKKPHGHGNNRQVGMGRTGKRKYFLICRNVSGLGEFCYNP